MKKAVFLPAEILLPMAPIEEKWPVLACDQFTSQPKYWQNVEDIVAKTPSTFNIIYPEVYLEAQDRQERIEKIHTNMEQYKRDILNKKINGYIYVERVLQSGKIRQGLVGVIDLEDYSFEKNASCRILPSENTLLERIPPRLAVRKGAVLETPHILMLADDEKFQIIEPLADKKEKMELLYNINLMLDGGNICGWAVTDKTDIENIQVALARLEQEERFKQRYNTKHSCFSFIVGDGNHSLATAKAYWEELKPTLSEEERENNPARFCLLELENVQSDAIEIEPIHRVVFHADANHFLNSFYQYFETNGAKINKHKSEQNFLLVMANKEVKIGIDHSIGAIEAATIDKFLEYYMANQPQITVDYVHGEKAVQELVNDGAIGIILPAIEKSDLFKGVANGGVLPKKTFSMGHAQEKRYYIECRKIKK